ncbi:MAG: prolyl oligopeptidase family serine peptidase [Candidatus Latescibacteria bacterium]|nr:prolyl oligopeptidase family serine peptidase [Candidatus Latescibacterota bacterium]NIM64407.1 prolyl oligopeptidase family serine peptidase [Candidatus Latescibacterota bacterium]NIO00561.1 prolyl oligopeptidase family serine peptidase [Candidatus Latescibacterota bacterium]NIO26961.1 prolyl oligopeptidase family serine peptidase [Candidatus Latescibacterota bacterium]NIO56038.1 prolyl oligopeptidase family serine peptidase [Candidatus Latescibacterota bacterium]
MRPKRFRISFFCAIAMMILIAAGNGNVWSKGITFDEFFSLGRISDPQISPDGEHVAFVVTWHSKETNDSNSDIYLVPIKGLEEGAEPIKLTNSPGGDSHPRFSPDGRNIAFTSSRSGKSQVWMLPMDGGEAWQLTHLSTGASNPQWTPNGKHILFTSKVYPDCPDDDCNAKRIEEKEKSPVKARIITDLLYRHWDHWRGERRSHVFAVPSEGGKPMDLTPVSYDVPTFALGSGHDIAISPDGKELCVVSNTDPNPAWSTNNDLLLLSIEDVLSKKTGESTEIEKPKRLTNNPANDNHPVYSPNGRYIAYRAMARPGFEADQYRLMLYDRKKNEFNDLGIELADKYRRSVGSIAWSPNSKDIYVTCQDQGYISVYLIEAKNGKVKQLTEKMTIASVRICSDKKRVAFVRQNASMPYEVFAADRSFKKIKMLSHINDEILASLKMNPLEEFWFKGAENADVHGWLLKPPGFKKGTKYPMIFLVHGGPQGAWEDEFHFRWNYQMFASPGYVVVAINPRGSTGYGQKFTDEISRDWGGKVYEDLMKGLDYVLAEYSDMIDPDRIAAAGASYGGYMINWIEGHTDRFKCLVNHDGVYNLTSMYGTTEELWFPEWDLGNTPWENPEGYAKFSPHTFAKNFKTPMLIVHGQLDYRVPFGEAMQVFTALRRQGVPAKLLYFPDENHFVLKPQNAELWWKTVHEWIAEWVQ